MAKVNNNDISNHELLEAINGGFGRVEERLQNVESEMTGMKSEMTGMKSEMTGMKSEISDTKSELRSFKEETGKNFKEVNEKLNLVIEDVASHSERIEKLEVASSATGEVASATHR